MYVIDGKVISSEVFRRKFVCNLSKCKGACCWEGDFGAPVDEKEAAIMKEQIQGLLPALDQSSRDIIAKKGVSPYDDEYKGMVTPLKSDGSCVYLVQNKSGIAQCGWEQLYNDGKSSFRKPISCHLYPIRVENNKNTGWEALNYDEWDICSAACTLGEELQVPVFRFLKDALIRAYGQGFYDQMEALYEEYIIAEN